MGGWEANLEPRLAKSFGEKRGRSFAEEKSIGEKREILVRKKEVLVKNERRKIG